MKALIRKHGYTPTDIEQNEVYVEPWLSWVDKITGAPLTDENYGYALCDDIPSGVDAQELTVDDFEVTQHTREEASDIDDEKVIVRYWKAKYIGGN